MSQAEREARRERLAALRAAGVDAYPARVGPREPIAAVRARYEPRDAAALDAEPPRAAIAGRVMALRSFGKLLFATLREDGATLQISARREQSGDAVFEAASRLDVGDFVRVEGVVWRTKKGELTLDARELTLLAKGLAPLPEKWHGLTDVEARFRQRYLDLLVNEDARRIAILRSRIVSAMRAFLDGRGFVEIETPVLQPIYGGAAARPFTTHHNAYGQQLYLRISDELYLKRLVVGGIERVYEIGRVFRNEGVSRKHNPEFTMMECYQAYADYGDMMELTQSMIQAIAQTALGTTRISHSARELELAGEWPRITLRDAIANTTGIDVLADSDLASLRAAIARAGIACPDAPTWGRLVDELFSAHVESGLIQPCFIVDYPVELSPLAKRKQGDPRLVERFEAFLGGMEVGNSFSELNDPLDQRGRMEQSLRDHAAGDEEAQPLDEDFLAALEVGMPPTGGLGIGVDRLVMQLLDAPSLREVIAFPYTRPREGGDE